MCEILVTIKSNGNELIATHVLYKTNLSWNIMRVCMELLEKKGLLHFVKDDCKITKGHYILTEKGLAVASQYESLKEVLGESD